MATSIISAGDAANLGIQTTGGDDGVLVLRSGAAGAKVDALSIAASGTATFVDDVAVTGDLTANNFAGRNLIINGAMQVAQRGTSFAAISSNTYTLDRWQLQAAGAGRCTITQSTTAPNNFVYSTKVDVTTADTSLGATDLQSFTQRMEGNVVSQIGLGTSSAKSFTVSFWVRSNKTGIYCVSIRNASGGRSIASEYTISSADTWEHKEVTFSGDTTGSYNTGNTEAFNVNFVLLAGTDRDGKTANTWEANTAFATDNQVNLFDNTSNEWYITGVQLEISSTTTEFEHQSFGKQLALCQRYYYRETAGTAYTGFAISVVEAATYSSGMIRGLPVTMRAVPTVSQSNCRLFDGSVTPAVTSLGTNFGSTTSFGVACIASGGGLTVGRAVSLQANNNTAAYIDASAEL